LDSEAESEYTAFVTHHANAMWRTAYLLCGDRRRAEDATQEALLRLYRRWPRLYRRADGSLIPAYEGIRTVVGTQQLARGGTG